VQKGFLETSHTPMYCLQCIYWTLACVHHTTISEDVLVTVHQHLARQWQMTMDMEPMWQVSHCAV